jgi:tRNA (cytidine/uridine-2'-O-)-methyltransferase
MPELALYQPEIAANLGAMIRTAACFEAAVHVIEPCGFPWREREIARTALDYRTALHRHRDWASFFESASGRLVLLTTKAETSLYQTQAQPSDILLMGQESAGVPDYVRDAVDLRVRIPLAESARSLNVGVAAAVALAEWRRQIYGLSLTSPSGPAGLADDHG